MFQFGTPGCKCNLVLILFVSVLHFQMFSKLKDYATKLSGPSYCAFYCKTTIEALMSPMSWPLCCFIQRTNSCGLCCFSHSNSGCPISPFHLSFLVNKRDLDKMKPCQFLSTFVAGKGKETWQSAHKMSPSTTQWLNKLTDQTKPRR